MKIIDLKTEVLEAPYSSPGKASTTEQYNFDVILVRVYSDEGITGISSASPAGGSRYAIYNTIERVLKPNLIGEDPFRAEKLIRPIRSARRFGTICWLVEIALWDIVGKACNQPIYRLWGGYQDKIRAYASLAYRKRTPKQRAEDAVKIRERGFTALKLKAKNVALKDDLKLIAAVHDEVGAEMDIMVDAHQGSVAHFTDPAVVWDYQRAAIMARELESLGVVWLEEPLARYNIADIKRLTANTSIPIAGGEGNIGLPEFKILLDQNCYDIIQPDATVSEGLFQVRKIAALAELCFKPCIPHTWCTGLGFVANLQLAASLPNCPFIEYVYDPPMIDESFHIPIAEPLLPDDKGFIHLPEKPGLGVEIDESLIKKYQIDM